MRYVFILLVLSACQTQQEIRQEIAELDAPNKQAQPIETKVSIRFRNAKWGASRQQILSSDKLRYDPSGNSLFSKSKDRIFSYDCDVSYTFFKNKFYMGMYTCYLGNGSQPWYVYKIFWDRLAEKYGSGEFAKNNAEWVNNGKVISLSWDNTLDSELVRISYFDEAKMSAAVKHLQEQEERAEAAHNAQSQEKL